MCLIVRVVYRRKYDENVAEAVAGVSNAALSDLQDTCALRLKFFS